MEWIFSDVMLEESASRQDGIEAPLEKSYRRKTAWFIEELGKEIKCVRMVVSTALVLFHRFYAFQSFKRHSRFIISVTCLFLASKVEETPKKLRDVVSAYFSVRRKFNYCPTETECKEMPNKILLAERILLQTLCFDMQLVHPYRACLDRAHKLKPYIPDECRKEFHQLTINFVNDSYRTTLCLQYPPHQIGLGALFLATLQLGMKPVNPNPRSTVEHTWFELLEPDIDDDVLKGICNQIIDVIVDDNSTGMTASGERKEIQLLRSRLEASHTQSLAMHHPSPTTITAVPTQAHAHNTKDPSNHHHNHSHSNNQHSHSNKDDTMDTDDDPPTHDAHDAPDAPRHVPSVPKVTVFRHLSSGPPLPSPSISLPSATPPPPPDDTPTGAYQYALPTPEGMPPNPPDTPGTAPPPPPTPPSERTERHENFDAPPMPPPTPVLDESVSHPPTAHTAPATTVTAMRRPLDTDSTGADADAEQGASKRPRL